MWSCTLNDMNLLYGFGAHAYTSMLSRSDTARNFILSCFTAQIHIIIIISLYYTSACIKLLVTTGQPILGPQSFYDRTQKLRDKK